MTKHNKFNISDTFIVTGYTGYYEIGDIISIKKFKQDTDIFYCQNDCQIIFEWVKPTLETKAKYSKIWKLIKSIKDIL